METKKLSDIQLVSCQKCGEIPDDYLQLNCGHNFCLKCLCLNYFQLKKTIKPDFQLKCQFCGEQTQLEQDSIDALEEVHQTIIKKQLSSKKQKIIMNKDKKALNNDKFKQFKEKFQQRAQELSPKQQNEKLEKIKEDTSQKKNNQDTTINNNIDFLQTFQQTISQNIKSTIKTCFQEEFSEIVNSFNKLQAQFLEQVQVINSQVQQDQKQQPKSDNKNQEQCLQDQNDVFKTVHKFQNLENSINKQVFSTAETKKEKKDFSQIYFSKHIGQNKSNTEKKLTFNKTAFNNSKTFTNQNFSQYYSRKNDFSNISSYFQNKESSKSPRTTYLKQEQLKKSYSQNCLQKIINEIHLNKKSNYREQSPILQKLEEQQSKFQKLSKK